MHVSHAGDTSATGMISEEPGSRPTGGQSAKAQRSSLTLLRLPYTGGLHSIVKALSPRPLPTVPALLTLELEDGAAVLEDGLSPQGGELEIEDELPTSSPHVQLQSSHPQG